MLNENLINKDRNVLIEKNKPFIYKTTHRICKRNLDWNNDDELSVALIAFNKACDNYTIKRGNFYSYASIVIKNSLIDYFRKRDSNIHLTYENGNSIDSLTHTESITQFNIQSENEIRTLEIEALNIELKKYKISFYDLVNNSPKHLDTREKLLNLAFLCVKNNNILESLNTKCRLPIKEIIILTGEKRKYLEKWRKYIIVLVIILSNDDYQYIKSYLSIKVGD